MSASKICRCCGGPRSIYSTAWCLSCWRLETRPAHFDLEHFDRPFFPGVTAETKSHFKADADALRRHGCVMQADEIDRDMARLEELAIKYGFIAHSDHAPHPRS